MAEDAPKFEFDLGDHGGLIQISSPDELRAWAENEFRAWEWLRSKGVSALDDVFQKHQNWNAQLQNYSNEWRAYHLKNRDNSLNILNQLRSIFNDYYVGRKIFHTSNPQAAFLSELKEKYGEITAGGAYLVLLGANFPGGHHMPAALFEGILQAFLYKYEINWTGSAHQEILNCLRKQFEAEIAKQDGRFKEIETQNSSLNKTFENTLKEKSTALQKLHDDQSSDFQKLIGEHEKNLKLIEITYDQKLALQKPVKYWQTKESFHGRRAKVFGWTALVTGLVLVGGMGGLVYWVFSALQPNDNPKHWQLGILIVGAFFSIWLIRIFVRMFFSHLHLATDAAERRTMILTYLAMSREGAQFAKEDKTLIVQHLFRSASDGYVKDDAAPPNFLELFSRGK